MSARNVPGLSFVDVQFGTYQSGTSLVPFFLIVVICVAIGSCSRCSIGLPHLVEETPNRKNEMLRSHFFMGNMHNLSQGLVQLDSPFYHQMSVAEGRQLARLGLLQNCRRA